MAFVVADEVGVALELFALIAQPPKVNLSNSLLKPNPISKKSRQCPVVEHRQLNLSVSWKAQNEAWI